MKDPHTKYFKRLLMTEVLLKGIDKRLDRMENKIISNLALTIFIKVIAIALSGITLWLTTLTYIIFRR